MDSTFLKLQVGEGQLESVLVELSEKAEHENLNIAIVLLNQLNRLKLDSTKGILPWKEKFETETRIVVSGLNLIDSIANK